MSAIVPKIFDEPPASGSTGVTAEAEAAAIASGKLAREESFKKHLHWGSLVIFWFAVVAIVAMVGVWLFNILTPKSWRFLEESELSHLQSMIIAGLGSTFVTTKVKRMMGQTE